jgi:hypothetical protein
MKVSIFKNKKDVNNPFDRDIQVCLDRIKNGKSKDAVELYRNTFDSKIKDNLPGVCFSGTFNYRNEEGLVNHSGLIILDFDKYDIENGAQKKKEELINDPYVFAAFISPSGSGVKVLIKVPPIKEDHKLYFNSIFNKYDDGHLDQSGKDVSRLCFESYDSDLYYNPDSLVWTEKEESEIEDIGFTREKVIVPMTSDSQIIDKLKKWFEKKYSMAKGERNANLFKFAIALSDFGITQHNAESFLSQYESHDFRLLEILTTIKSAYRKGEQQFGSKYFEDKVLKEKIEKKVFSGAKAKDIRSEFISQKISIAENESSFNEILDSIKKNREVEVFWYYTDKGKIMLSPHDYKSYLESNNYLKYFPQNNSNTFVFVRKDKNLIELTNEKRIKDFVLTDLLNRGDVGFQPYDFMALNTKYFTSEFLSLINSADIKIKEDTEHECYLYYQNCAVKITKDSVEEIDYLDLDGYVWKDQIINRDFKKHDHHKAMYRSFIWYIAGQDREKYNSFKSVIGYLLHTYKKATDNQAIILNDESISENPDGRSGKGLFCNAIRHLKKLSKIDGKQFDFHKSFPYQSVSTDCQVLVFDDIKKNFAFENLFSLITEGITIEYKGQDAIHIPVEKSPKIVITTNYTVKGNGGSFEARKFELELSNYFNVNYTPEDKFGKRLFDSWNENEWAEFDNYMINCLQFYLQKGLQKHDYKNLEVRKFINATSYEFFEWTQSPDWIIFGERYTKGMLYERFCEEFAVDKKYLTPRRFKMFLKEYCTYFNCEYLEPKSNGIRYEEIKKIADTPTTDPNPFNTETDEPF